MSAHRTPVPGSDGQYTRRVHADDRRAIWLQPDEVPRDENGTVPDCPIWLPWWDGMEREWGIAVTHDGPMAIWWDGADDIWAKHA